MSQNSEANNSNFVRYMSNPRAFTLKRWFVELLGGNYSPHDSIIERVAGSLHTEKDLEDFGKLVGQLFETAYRKAVDDYREQIEKLGLKISLVPQELNSQKKD